MKQISIEGILRRVYTAITTDNGAISHEVLTLNNAGVFSLTPPVNAQYALIVVEEVGSSGSSKVVRYFLDGTNPTASVGIVRGDGDAFDISGKVNLDNFRVIKVAGGNHTLTVQYFL